jgi:hypothetical protein
MNSEPARIFAFFLHTGKTGSRSCARRLGPMAGRLSIGLRYQQAGEQD